MSIIVDKQWNIGLCVYKENRLTKDGLNSLIAILVVCLRIKNDDTTSKQTVKISPVRKEVY